jgi:hypothetical protein
MVNDNLFTDTAATKWVKGEWRTQRVLTFVLALIIQM